MGSTSSNSMRAVASVNQSMLNTSNNQCYSNSSVSVTGNTFNLTCTGNCNSITGINIQGSLNSTCTILQASSQLATTNIASQLDQQAIVQNDLFNDFLFYTSSSNSADLLQSVVNSNISTSSNVCVSDSYIDSTDNVVNISTGSAGSVTGVVVSADANSSCQIQALSKMTAYNNLQAALSQKSKVMGMFVAIITVLVIGVVIVTIAIVALFATGKIVTGFANSSKGKNDNRSREEALLNDIITPPPRE